MRKLEYNFHMAVHFSFRFLIVFVCLTLLRDKVAFGQEINSVDSLKKALVTPHKSDRIDILNKLSEIYRGHELFDTSRVFAIQAARESEKIKYTLGSGDAYLNLASVGYQTGDFTAVESDCRMAIELFKKVNDDDRLARAHSVLGTALWAQSRFDPANEEFNKAIHLFTLIGDSSKIGLTYSLMALLEGERGNYERSFQYCVKALPYGHEHAFIALGQLYVQVGDYATALEYYDKITSKSLKRNNYLRVGEAYALQNKYDSAMHYYKLIIKERGTLSKNRISKPYALLGELYLNLKKYDSALFYLNTSLNDFKETHNGNWIMRESLQLGRAYKEVGDLTSAAEYSRSLLSDATASGARQYIRDAHYLLFELFDGTHQSDSAYLHLKNYTILNKAIDIDVSARKLAFYKTSTERQRAQLQIDLLSKQKQLQQEDLEQTSQQKKLLFISILGLILIGIVLVRNVLLNKRNEKHRRELVENELHIQKLESKKQLGELEIQLLRAQMNPHFIFNSLNSINRFILQNNKLQASEYLTKFSMLVRMILQNSQSELITVQEELESLELYLSLEALRFDDHFSYKITVQDDLDIASLKVPPLIIQPYAENAVWHGLMHKEESGLLLIEVFVESGWLCLKITDDGVGRGKAQVLERKTDSNHRSMGLGITSHRISKAHEQNSKEQGVIINDLVDPDGDPCGTEVIIKLPLSYD